MFLLARGRCSCRAPPGSPARLLGCSAARGRLKVLPRFPQAFLRKSLGNGWPRFPQGSPEVPPRFPQGPPGSPGRLLGYSAAWFPQAFLKKSLRNACPRFPQGSPEVPPRFPQGSPGSPGRLLGCSAAWFPQAFLKKSLRNACPRFPQGSPARLLGCSAGSLTVPPSFP